MHSIWHWVPFLKGGSGRTGHPRTRPFTNKKSPAPAPSVAESTSFCSSQGTRYPRCNSPSDNIKCLCSLSHPAYAPFAEQPWRASAPTRQRDGVAAVLSCATRAWRYCRVRGVPGLFCASACAASVQVLLSLELGEAVCWEGRHWFPGAGGRSVMLRRKQQAPTAEPRRSGAAVKPQHVARPEPATQTGRVTEQVRLLQSSLRPDKQPHGGWLGKKALLQSRAHPAMAASGPTLFVQRPAR